MPMNWRSAPSLSALRAFDATAREGDFAGAARALNVTHAAVAQQVRALERELGVSLAVRDGRSVRLTRAGIDLARALDDGFGTVAEGLAGLRRRAAQRGIRVTATPFLVNERIMPRLSEFWALHPGSEISIHPTRDYVDIVGEGFDLAIRAVPIRTELTWPGVDLAPISAVQMVAIAAPSLARDFSGDLQALPWLEHEGMSTKLIMMRECGLDTAALRFVPIGSALFLLEAVRQGLGATIFSEQFVREDLAAGRLVELPLPDRLSARYLAATPKGPRHPLVDPFVDWVRTLF